MKKQEQSSSVQIKGDFKKYSQPSFFKLGDVVKTTLSGAYGAYPDNSAIGYKNRW